MRVKLSPRASRELERAVVWWKENCAGEPPILVDLEEAVRLLAEVPKHGVPFVHSRGRLIRRVLLRASQHHVFYKIEGDVVLVACIWSTARSRSPRFGPP